MGASPLKKNMDINLKLSAIEQIAVTEAMWLLMNNSKGISDEKRIRRSVASMVIERIRQEQLAR